MGGGEPPTPRSITVLALSHHATRGGVYSLAQVAYNVHRRPCCGSQEWVGWTLGGLVPPQAIRDYKQYFICVQALKMSRKHD